jgi:peptidoglycan/xylan/chitin deacetylase (PgdA/CDA1 family)
MSPAMRPVLNLNFHGIGAPNGRDFGDGEREFWATPSIFGATLDAAVGRDDMTLSFDDGNSTDVEIVLPALTQRGLSATFFIVPSWLGNPGFITEADVRRLAQDGMQIGNHGLAHHFWTELTPTQLSHEVSEGRRQLERVTAGEIKTLAIPYGAYDATVLRALGEHGYEHVFTSDGGVADGDAWLQPREHLRADHTQTDLDRLLGPPRESAL